MLLFAKTMKMVPFCHLALVSYIRPLPAFPVVPTHPPSSWQCNVPYRLIEEVCRFVRQSNQSASHKTTG